MKIDAMAADNFWAKVEKTPTCWLWTAALSGDGRFAGYGLFNLKGKMWKAHRLAYTLLIGKIPKGLELDHLCHGADCNDGPNCLHRRCVNPAHLKPVTHAENASKSSVGGRIWRRSITHCPQGHEYTEDNTYYSPLRPTHRNCRECRRINVREYQRKRRAREKLCV
jgi:hypothetical protein